MDWSDSGYLALSALNVRNGYIDPSTDAHYGDQELYDKWMTGKDLYEGQVLFTTEAPIGNVAQVPDNNKYILSQRTIAFDVNSDKITDDFLAVLLRSPKAFNELSSLASGGTAKGVSQKSLSQFKVTLPNNLEEQNKISSFFKQLDNTIALHQRKIEQLKLLKKAFLQKMLANQESVPELRFADFDEEWEPRKLLDVANIVGGGTPNTNNPEFWDGDIDWYSPVEIGEQIYVNNSRKKISYLGLQKSSAKILPVGTVLFTSRAGIGNTAILAKEGATNQGFQSIIPHKDKLDSYFIYSRTPELKRYGELSGAGSTFIEVSGKQMANMSLLFPNLKEQQKIGSFLKQIDNTISLHKKKLFNIKKLKKACIQSMFI
ncbi:restriction endonuclease subunit S [Enterococcus mundtii]|uniref:restriction endonuclease subunit S n=1 Tax=Enterococcus mundtii TaxID=53346 RepID=UPI00403C6B11